jgi:NodT family efflux transporter outer membrane factor (OMF) lipoprotein
MNRATAAHTAAWLLAVVMLHGCAVGPDYVRPTLDVPGHFKEASGWKPAQPADHLPRDGWWKIFGDPLLDHLEAQVSIDNQNIVAAEAQLRQARALAGASQAALFPTVTGNLSATRSYVPPTVSTNPGVSVDHNLGVAASWEADLWGRIGRGVEAADASAQASAADVESLRLSAQAELARDYLLLRISDVQRRLLDDTVAAYAKSLQLTRNRLAVGVAMKLDVMQAETQYKTVQAQALDLGVQRAQLEHAIALLTGKAAAAFAIEAQSATPGLPQIPFAVPSTLLERRPDIAAAERRAAAANAQIGVARGAYFPSVTLSATAGSRSASAATWLTTPAHYWSLGPNIAEALFDGGLREARVAQAQAASDGSIAVYRQTVLQGFSEVEDNLAALRVLEEEAKVQGEAVDAAQQTLKLTTSLYRAGTVGYLNVIVAQAAALASERTAIDILSRRLTSSVNLVKSLGGGWQANAPG